MRAQLESKMERAEMRMYGVSLKDSPALNREE